MLRPIPISLVLSFGQPSRPGVTSFWNRIGYHDPVRCGTKDPSSWLAASCHWNVEGELKATKSLWSKEPNKLFDGVEDPLVDIDKGTGRTHKRASDCRQMPGRSPGDEGRRLGVAASASPGSTAPGENASVEKNSCQPAQLILDTVRPVHSGWVWETPNKTVTERLRDRKNKPGRMVSEKLDPRRKETRELDHDGEWYDKKSERRGEST